MIHQPSGGAQGQATDIQIQAEEIIKLKKQLNQVSLFFLLLFTALGICLARIGHRRKLIKPEILCFKIYVRHTGKDISYIEDNMERDKFMSPKEAMDFGLVDRILEHPPRQGQIYLL